MPPDDTPVSGADELTCRQRFRAVMELSQPDRPFVWTFKILKATGGISFRKCELRGLCAI